MHIDCSDMLATCQEKQYTAMLHSQKQLESSSLYLVAYHRGFERLDGPGVRANNPRCQRYARRAAPAARSAEILVEH